MAGPRYHCMLSMGCCQMTGTHFCYCIVEDYCRFAGEGGQMSSGRRSRRLQPHGHMDSQGRRRNCLHAADMAVRLNDLFRDARRLVTALDSPPVALFVHDVGRDCSFQHLPLYRQSPSSKSHSHTWALQVEHRRSFPSWSRQIGHTAVPGDYRLAVMVEPGSLYMVKAGILVVEDRQRILPTAHDGLEETGSMHYSMRKCRSNIRDRNTGIELYKRRRIER